MKHVFCALAFGFALPVSGLPENSERYREQCAEIITARAKTGENERLWSLFEANWKYRMVESPELATWRGYPGQNHRWSDLSLAAIGRRKEDTRQTHKTILSIDRSRLTVENQLNYDLFLRNTAMSVEGQQFPAELLAINQMDGLPRDVPSMIEMMPANRTAQYEDILARLNGIPSLVNQTLALLRMGLEKGIVPPRVPLRTLPDQAKNQVQENPMESPLLSKFQRFPEGMDEGDRDRLRLAVETVYRASVRPSFERFHQFLRDEYVPRCRETVGRSNLPKGQAWYAYRIKHYTTMSLTPDEIHQTGLREVKRIRREMKKTLREVGFEGDLKAFFDFLRKDPRFYFNTADELLGGYRDICKRADPELTRLFGKLPRQPYGVKPVPSYIEKSVTTAYYQPGSNAAGRAGFFFANTYDLASRPKWEMEALALHEAVPGHHLQLAIADEIEGLPEFRKYGRYTAYVEGWGLYSESLGTEMGFYTDPYSKFGQLTYEMWRAIRLVVDTGIHAKGWSRSQAVAYMLANSGIGRSDAEAEVDRYIANPGQALSYKIGALTIQRLRREAEAALGPKFDLKAFHEQVLGSGVLPLPVLETKVRRWIAQNAS